jgi:hypothetical protein
MNSMRHTLEYSRRSEKISPKKIANRRRIHVNRIATADQVIADKAIAGARGSYAPFVCAEFYCGRHVAFTAPSKDRGKDKVLT